MNVLAAYALLVGLGVLIGIVLGVMMMVNVADHFQEEARRERQKRADLEALIRSDDGDFRHRVDVVELVPYRNHEEVIGHPTRLPRRRA